MEELIQRLNGAGARGVFIVTLHKGNPGVIRLVLPTGVERLRVKIDGVVLRREVQRHKRVQIHSIRSLSIPPGSSLQTSRLADELGSLLDVPVEELPRVAPEGADARGAVDIRLTDFYGGRTLWTHLHAEDGTEIGPRIRVGSARWLYSNEE